MITLRKHGFILVCLTLGAVGCTSSRFRTHQAAIPPAGVEKTVSTAHLLRVARILENQNQTERAREIYRDILKRDPAHAIAKSRLRALQSPEFSDQLASNSPFVIPDQADRPKTKQSSTKKPSTESSSLLAEKAIPTPEDLLPNDIPKSSPAENTPRKFVQPDISQPAKPVVKDASGKLPAGFATPKLAVSSTPDAAQLIQIVPQGGEAKNPFLKPFQVTSKLRTTKVTKGKTPSPVNGKKHTKALPVFARPVSQPKVKQHLIRVIPRSEAGQPRVRELKIEVESSPIPPKQKNHSQPTSLKKRAKTSSATKNESPNPFELKPNPTAPTVATEKIDEQITALMDRKADNRALAAFALGRMGSQARKALSHLERAMKNEKSGPVKVRLAEAILRITTQHEEAGEFLVESLGSIEEATRWEAVCAAEVLARKGSPFGEDAAKQLMKLLDDANPKMRTMSALKLAEYGDVAVAVNAVSHLRQVAVESQGPLHVAAVAALEILAPAKKDHRKPKNEKVQK
ncbi:MAG: hypothetical protein Tsb009_09690 [Planctomycetaceae bacterium]